MEPFQSDQRTAPGGQRLRPPLWPRGAGRPNRLAARPDADDRRGRRPSGDPDAILCRICGRGITRESARCAVGGTHAHTFANPAGQVFDIGCFHAAPGCVGEGPSTVEFTWFAGYRWRVVVCGGCRNHIGWQFISATDRFFGLILNRLIHSSRRMH